MRRSPQPARTVSERRAKSPKKTSVPNFGICLPGCATRNATANKHHCPNLKVLRLSNLTRSMRSSVCWNCSSVSPGKPTMTSPVMAASGASCKTVGGGGGDRTRPSRGRGVTKAKRPLWYFGKWLQSELAVTLPQTAGWRFSAIGYSRVRRPRSTWGQSEPSS